MIKTTVQFTDHSIEFKARNAVMADTMMGIMAASIEGKMKTGGEVPFLPKSTKWAKRGALRTEIRHRKVSVGQYEVTAGGEVSGAYAAAQEAGQSRGHTFKHYSTPGTGPHWFQHAIDKVKDRASEYAATAKRAAGL